MITLSGTGDLLASLQTARSVAFSAYILRPGAVLDALVAAAARGAQVEVRLEGSPYADASGTLRAWNDAAVGKLRAAGADACEVDLHPTTDGPPLHLKAALVDASLYLDDRNFPDGGADTILRDDFSGDADAVRRSIEQGREHSTALFATRKSSALLEEAHLIASAQPGDTLQVESEAFGAQNAVADALGAAAQRGVHVDLLVARRDLAENPREAAALATLTADGVNVRTGDADEKFALLGTRGWVGSANATGGYPWQRDWGMRTDAPTIIAQLQARFAQRF